MRSAFAERISFYLSVKLGNEGGHKLQLEEVRLMLAVDDLLFDGIIDLAGADISVKLGVGKAEILLVGLTAQTVYRYFLNKISRYVKQIADLLDLLNGQSRKGAEIAGGVAVSGGISDPILREVAGIDNSAVTALGNGVDGGHTKSGGQVIYCLLGELQLLGNVFENTLKSVLDIHYVMLDTQMLYYLI